MARYKQFLLFPQCIQKTCTADTSRPGLVWERVNQLFLNPSPDDKILALSKLKALAEDNFIVVQILQFFFEREGNIMGKGENADYQLTSHLFFPSLFLKGFFPKTLKGGYLGFSHVTELKNIYFTEIYIKKLHKSSIIKNHKITNENFIDGVPLNGYVAP